MEGIARIQFLSPSSEPPSPTPGFILTPHPHPFNCPRPLGSPPTLFFLYQYCSNRVTLEECSVSELIMEEQFTQYGQMSTVASLVFWTLGLSLLLIGSVGTTAEEVRKVVGEQTWPFPPPPTHTHHLPSTSSTVSSSAVDDSPRLRLVAYAY